jgi:hypothetical protein
LWARPLFMRVRPWRVILDEVIFPQDLLIRKLNHAMQENRSGERDPETPRNRTCN